MNIDPTDKVAIVTGGGSGIGRAVVHALVKSGAKVVVADISEEGGAETVELVGGSSSARFVATDVSDESSVNGLVEETLRAYGRLDIAHNNAGMERGKMVVRCFTRSPWTTSSASLPST